MTYAQLLHTEDWQGMLKRIKEGNYENDVIVWTNLWTTNQKTAEHYGRNNREIMMDVDKALKQGLKPITHGLYHVERHDMDVMVYTKEKRVTVVIFKENADEANGHF